MSAQGVFKSLVSQNHTSSQGKYQFPCITIHSSFHHVVAGLPTSDWGFGGRFNWGNFSFNDAFGQIGIFLSLQSHL